MLVVLQESIPNDCGVLAVRVVVNGDSTCKQVRVECAAVHYSRSMGVAWADFRNMAKPESHMLRQAVKPSQGSQRLSCVGSVRHW